MRRGVNREGRLLVGAVEVDDDVVGAAGGKPVSSGWDADDEPVGAALSAQGSSIACLSF